jgi:hypothetical protein
VYCGTPLIVWGHVADGVEKWAAHTAHGCSCSSLLVVFAATNLLPQLMPLSLALASRLPLYLDNCVTQEVYKHNYLLTKHIIVATAALKHEQHHHRASCLLFQHTYSTLVNSHYCVSWRSARDMENYMKTSGFDTERNRQTFCFAAGDNAWGKWLFEIMSAQVTRALQQEHLAQVWMPVLIPNSTGNVMCSFLRCM